jgi:hypothetical protein
MLENRLTCAPIFRSKLKVLSLILSEGEFGLVFTPNNKVKIYLDKQTKLIQQIFELAQIMP